ncbi:MAG: TAT-variant-translocated molybdopterin oxidoreductase [Acidobacteriota bacterium]
MSSLERVDKGAAYWRSLDELADTPEFRGFVEKEFPDFAGEMLAPPNRRTFMKLMGASVALAGFTACRWPKEKIMPWARQPEGRLPGVPVQYATTWDFAGNALGLLVTSYDGRPIKVEGNPEHPFSLGAASGFMQALLLEMYDPDRSRYPIEGNEGRGWEEFDAAWRDAMRTSAGRAGAGTAILSEAISSPTVARLRAELAKQFPQLKWVEYEPVSRDNERAGTTQAFGSPMRPQWVIDQAEIIVALDSDFLHDHPAALRSARQFAAKRRADNGSMNRLYAFEPAYSITGAAADHRLALSTTEISQLALHLAGNGNAPGGEAGALAEAIRHDLEQHRGRGLVIAGPRQPAAVHAAVALINAAYGNAGATVGYVADDAVRPTHTEAITQLASAMNAGSVDTLLILGSNPVYNAPVDIDFGAALAKVKNSFHLGLYRDETALACGWHAPMAHTFETWSDARAWDGTVSVIQPLIEPLFGGKTASELLAAALGTTLPKSYNLVRETHADLDEKAWRSVLHAGLIAGTALTVAAPTPITSALALTVTAANPTPGALELVFLPDNSVYDGRFANNAWLQENPDPLTKLVWDNAVLVGPSTADALGLKQASMARLSVGERSLDAAVYTMPGMAPNVVALSLGYGRNGLGWRVSEGAGFNAYAVRTAAMMDVAQGATLQATGATYDLVTTQDHWAIDSIGTKETQRRIPELVKEATLEEYKANPEFAAHGEIKLFNLWTDHEYEGHKWAMAIDLSACIGCGACTMACQAENNIPVVGKDQVRRGREMHWIRLDRYFRGQPDTAHVVFQPVTCMHCENAPCEQVCPVAATVHDQEGLNVMVYNRCIGTRYCSNNCPYKVRRFNYYNWHNPPQGVPGLGAWRPPEKDPLIAMVYNPEVTVRTRGVMEKCNYCVQRINTVKIQSKNDRRPVRDGEIVTACEQTCPTQAITFGDLNDEASRVRKAHAHQRTYAMLQELNVRPRTQYMARLKNPSAGAPGQATTNEGHA